ncbi:MAG: hypothetical protein HY036_03590 [Nitrospirae bacterium]|nr:hypothetical protein [Nitrospirota bacterium]MBI3351639.1 hypothetical protein [Nitrospirota bacterium]
MKFLAIPLCSNRWMTMEMRLRFGFSVIVSSEIVSLQMSGQIDIQQNPGGREQFNWHTEPPMSRWQWMETVMR